MVFSQLTLTAIYPKPVKRQNIALCLLVKFCDEIVHALKVHPAMLNEEVTGTLMYMENLLDDTYNIICDIYNVNIHTKI